MGDTFTGVKYGMYLIPYIEPRVSKPKPVDKRPRGEFGLWKHARGIGDVSLELEIGGFIVDHDRI
jgi:hypothetical protein